MKQTKKYIPYKGFHNLLEFNLPKRLFKKFWNIQDALYEMEKNKQYYKKYHPAQWIAAQLLSADYQNLIFQHKQQPRESITHSETLQPRLFQMTIFQ